MLIYFFRSVLIRFSHKVSFYRAVFRSYLSTGGLLFFIADMAVRAGSLINNKTLTTTPLHQRQQFQILQYPAIPP